MWKDNKGHNIMKHEEVLRMEIRQACLLLRQFDEKLENIAPAFLLDPNCVNALTMRQNLVGAAGSIVSAFSNLIVRLHSVCTIPTKEPHGLCNFPNKDIAKPIMCENVKTSKHKLKLHTEPFKNVHQGVTEVEVDGFQSKKRKSRNSEQETESHFRDGYRWRKYGQKEISGSKHPRCYYHCNVRGETGCPAIKHVQKSDAYPTAHTVIYKGNHICRLPGAKSLPRRRKMNPQGTGNSAFLKIDSHGKLQISSCCATLPSAQKYKASLFDFKKGIKEIMSIAEQEMSAEKKDEAIRNLTFDELCTSVSESCASVQSGPDCTNPKYSPATPCWFEETAIPEEAGSAEVQTSDLQLFLQSWLDSEEECDFPLFNMC